MNEAETRAEHIDPALKAAGWGVVEGSRIRREFAISPGRIEGKGRRGKGLTADYILEYRNTRLAVIEAKAWDCPLTLGVAQAKNYADKMAIRHTYSTNGQGVYAIDMLTGKEGKAASFPTPDELWAMRFTAGDCRREKLATIPGPDSWRDRFAAVPSPDKSGTWTLRFYQEIAVRRVLEAIEQGRDRVLLTLATGTGKTSIAFQIAWKLFSSRWNINDWRNGATPSRRPRILFLADRNNLADQAFNDFTAFAAFSEDALARIKPDDIRKKGKVPKNASVFFTIFQTFMSGMGPDGKPAPYFGEYPPDFFDFIVIDECHRGGANDESTWRGIMEYFKPAVQLGLTATPRRQENADTYRYFGEPVYIYSLKEGINDGFLTPFRVKQITTSLDEYVYTPDDQVVEGEIEAGRVYEEKDFNKTIEIPEREANRVKIFMEQIDQREKTLVFCATQDHALMVRDLINQITTSTDPNYCHRVTADDGELGNQHLRDFQDNEKTIPTILTTSQKLSTGVDARNVRNIVLMRPINSMVEFKQIIGRGTRLYDGKDYFTIYDFVKAHHHFSDPEWDGEPLEPEPEPCSKCHQYPCECPDKELKAALRCPECGNQPCTCPKVPCPVCGEQPCVCRRKARVKLDDGKEREIQAMVSTTFWHPDGTPISAQEFMELLFGKLPEFFKDEAELRALWSVPDTRKLLLHGLAEKGFGAEQLHEMQKIINAEKSDLFDVLGYVAYALPPLTRTERAARAKGAIGSKFTNKQQAFLSFVLANYVQVGEEELDQSKLSMLLRLKYGTIPDAVADLGMPEEISQVFLGFQKYLYQNAPEI
jgi:type I restriction enzyme R subunit